MDTVQMMLRGPKHQTTINGAIVRWMWQAVPKVPDHLACSISGGLVSTVICVDINGTNELTYGGFSR